MKTIRKNTKLSLAGLAAGLLLVACDMGPTEADVAAPESPSTREHLAHAQPIFTMDGDSSRVTVAARLNRGSHWEEGQTAIEVEGGHVSLGADAAGDVVLEELDFAFADLLIGQETLPGGGIHLTDVRAHLDAPARASRSKWSPDEEFVYAEVEIDVTVEWALVVEGNSYPLGPLTLGPIPMELSVNRAAGLELDLAVSSDGVFWEHANSAELHDLQIVARGHEITVE